MLQQFGEPGIFFLLMVSLQGSIHFASPAGDFRGIYFLWIETTLTWCAVICLHTTDSSYWIYHQRIYNPGKTLAEIRLKVLRFSSTKIYLRNVANARFPGSPLFGWSCLRSTGCVHNRLLPKHFQHVQYYHLKRVFVGHNGGHWPFMHNVVTALIPPDTLQ